MNFFYAKKSLRYISQKENRIKLDTRSNTTIIDSIRNIDSSNRSVNYRPPLKDRDYLMFSILERYARFVSVRPVCIFNFLRSPEFMQRYICNDRLRHDERVCEKLSVIVERVCTMRRRKLPHAPLQFQYP